MAIISTSTNDNRWAGIAGVLGGVTLVAGGIGLIVLLTIKMNMMNHQGLFAGGIACSGLFITVGYITAVMSCVHLFSENKSKPTVVVQRDQLQLVELHEDL